MIKRCGKNKTAAPRGRPLLGAQRKIRVNIMLDPQVAKRLRALGDGNLSRGIEIAAKK